MMRIPVLIACLLFLLAQTAVAETVRVVSGEHPTFTRLVLYFDGPANWDIQGTAEGKNVSFDRANIEFDISSVYDLIPRTRFRDIEARNEEGSLLVAYGCACDLEVFTVQPNIVAIDLRGPPADPNETSERPRRRPTNAAETIGTALPFPLVPIPSPPIAPLQSESAPSAVVGVRERPPVEDVAAEFRSRLDAEVALALSEGLLNANPDIVLDSPDAAAVQSVDLSTPVDPPLRIVSATGAGQARVKTAESTCRDIPPILSDLGASEDLALDIFNAQRGLVDSAGRLDEAAVVTLFRTYIRANFAPEARLVYEEWPGSLQSDPGNMAVLEFLEVGEAPLLRQWPQCSAKGYLWAVLAGANPAPEVGAIETAFLALSHPLQKELLPRLEDRMRVLGRPDVMHAIRRGLELGARLRREGSSVEPSNKGTGPKLDAIDETTLPKDLVARFQEALGQETPVPTELIELATSIAIEHRDTQSGDELTAFSAIALMRNGRVSEAFDVWAQVQAASRLPKADARRAQFADEIANLGDGATFLTTAFGYAPWGWLLEANPEAAERMFERLEILGFRTADIEALGLRRSSAAFETSDVAPKDDPGGTAVTDPQETEGRDLRRGLSDLLDQFTEDQLALNATTDEFGLEQTQNLLSASEQTRALLEALSDNPLSP